MTFPHRFARMLIGTVWAIVVAEAGSALNADEATIRLITNAWEKRRQDTVSVVYKAAGTVLTPKGSLRSRQNSAAQQFLQLITLRRRRASTLSIFGALGSGRNTHMSFSMRT